jgi:MFS family permease
MRQLVVVTFLGFASFCLTLSSLPSYAASHGASSGTAGLVTTVMLVCTVGTQMLVPAAVDRFGLGPVLALGLVALGLPAPLYLLAHDLWWLLVVSAVRGLGFAVLTVLGSTITARIAPPGRMGEAVGLYGLAIALPNLLAVPGGVALQADGRFALVAFLAASPVLALPFVPALTRGVVAHSRDGGGTVGSARSAVRAVASPALLLLVVTLAGGGVVTFLPIARPDGVVAAVALLLFGATAAVARWAVGLAADRLGVQLLLPASLLTSAVGLVAVGTSLVAGEGAGTVAGVLVGATVFGIGYGATQNLTLVAALASTPQDNIASAVWNVGFDTGTALGAFAVGAVAATGFGLPWTFVASAAPILLVLPIARVRPVMRPA